MLLSSFDTPKLILSSKKFIRHWKSNVPLTMSTLTSDLEFNMKYVLLNRDLLCRNLISARQRFLKTVIWAGHNIPQCSHWPTLTVYSLTLMTSDLVICHIYFLRGNYCRKFGICNFLQSSLTNKLTLGANYHKNHLHIQREWGWGGWVEGMKPWINNYDFQTAMRS
jgi:hypothetical protein